MTKNKTDKLNKTNAQESADSARQQANKLLTAIAIEATEFAEKSISLENLKDKLIAMWASAPEETNSSELHNEITVACNAGKSAMEELLIEMMEMTKNDGNADESINAKYGRIDFDEEGTMIGSDLPTSASTSKRNQ